MASSNYNVNLKFTADAREAQQVLQSLQQSLMAVSNYKALPSSSLSAPLKEATIAATQLQAHLQNAFNVKTGNLDLSRLSRSLKSAGTDITTLSTKLLSAGVDGETAFMNIQRAITNSSIQIKTTNSLIDRMMLSLRNVAQYQISTNIYRGIVDSFSSAYNYAEDLNKSLNNIRIVTGQNIEQMDKFAEKANKAAKALSSTTLDYTNASLIYYQQGLTDQEVADRTAVTIKMANAAGESAETVSDQLTAVWNNFYNGSKSLEYYADVMTALGAATASSTNEISEGLEKFASVAETVGLSYEYAASALATVTATTRQSADVVGTAFKTLFARLQDLELGDTLDDGTTLGQYSEALNKVGVNIKNTNGEMKDMDDILDELGAKWSSLSKDTQVALAQTVAGTRQYTQLVALMNNWDYFKENLNVANTSSGTLQKQADTYAESWEAAQDRVQAAMEEIYSKLVDDEFFIKFYKGLEIVLDGVSGLVTSLGGLPGILLLLSNIAITKLQPSLAVGFQSGIDKVTELKERVSAVFKNHEWFGGLKTAFGGNAFLESEKSLQNINSTLDQVTSKTSTAADNVKLWKDHFSHVKDLTLTTGQAMTSNAIGSLDKYMTPAFSEWLRDSSQIQNIQGLIIENSKQLTSAEQKRLEIMQQQLLAAAEQKRQLIDQRDIAESQMLTWNEFLPYQEQARKGQDVVLRNISEDQVKSALDLIGSDKEIFITQDEGLQVLKEDVQIVIDRYKVYHQLANQVSSVQQIAVERQEDGLKVLQERILEITGAKNAADLSKNFGISEDVFNDYDALRDKIQQLNETTGNVVKAAIGQENFRNLTADIDNYSRSWIKAKQATAEYNNTLDVLKANMQETFSRLSSMETMLASFTQGLSTVAMGISSITNAVNVLQSNSHWATKLSTSLMAVTYGYKALTTAVTGANTVLGSFSITKAMRGKENLIGNQESIDFALRYLNGKNNILSVEQQRSANEAIMTVLMEEQKELTKESFTLEKGRLVLDEAQTAEAKRQLELQKKLKRAQNIQSLFSVVTVAAAAAAAVYLIGKRIEYLNNQLEASSQKADNWASSVQELENQFKEASDSYETLLTTITDYQSAVDGIKALQYGTAEFTTELTKANNQAMELLDLYGDIIDGNYEVNSQGLIVFDSGVLTQIKNVQAEKLAFQQRQLQIASQASREAEIEAKNTEFNRTAVQLSGYSDENAYYNQKNAGTGAQWGTALGAILGVGIALATGGAGLGLLLGGLAGLFGGAGVGAGLGAIFGGYNSETETEKKAIEALEKAYYNQGNAVLSSEDAIKQALESAGIDETAAEELSTALYDNKDAVEDLCAEYKTAKKTSRANAKSQVEQIIEDSRVVYGSKYEGDISSFLPEEYIQKTSQVTEEYLEKLKNADAGLWKEYAEQYAKDQGISKGFQLTGLNDQGNMTFSYYDDESKETQTGEIYAGNVASYYAAQDIDKYIEDKILEVNGVLDKLDENTVRYLKAFANNDFSDLSYDEIINLDGYAFMSKIFGKDEKNISDHDSILQDLGLSREGIKQQRDALLAQYKEWINSDKADWFSGLSNEERDLVLTYQLNPEASQNELEEKLKNLQIWLADHPLEATIQFYDEIEKAARDKDLDALKTAYSQRYSTEAFNKLLAESESWDDLLSKILHARYQATGVSEEYTYEDLEASLATAEAGVKAANDAYEEAKNTYETEAAKYDESEYVKFDSYWHYYDEAESALSKTGNGLLPATITINGKQIDAAAFKEQVHNDLINYINEHGSDELAQGYSEENRQQLLNTFNTVNWDNMTSDQLRDLVNRINTLYGLDEVPQALLDASSKLEETEKDREQANSNLTTAQNQIYNYLSQPYLQETEYLNKIEDYDLEEDTVKAYRQLIAAGQGFENDTGEDYAGKWLAELKDSDPEAYEKALNNLAITMARFSKGTKNLADNWEDWNEIMSDSTSTIDQIAEVLPELQESIANILDWDLSDIKKLNTNFYKTYWSQIQDVYNGVDGAVEKLAGLVTQEYVVQMGVDGSGLKGEVKEAWNTFQSFLTDMPDLEVGMTLNDDIYDALQRLLDEGVFTVEQMNSILEGIGYTPTYETEQVDVSSVREAVTAGKTVTVIDPVTGDVKTITATDQMDGWNDGAKITAFSFSGDGDGKPHINKTKTTYQGSGGAKTQAPSSSNGGGGSKPKKVDLTKKSDVVDRYKEINDSIEDNTQAMDKASKAADRLYGEARLKKMREVNNLVQKEISLNKQKREEALKYLATDKADLADAAKAAGVSFTFDEDGDIINYTEQMTKLWEELHAAEVAANADGNADEDEQEAIKKIQDKIDAVSEAIDQYEETKSLIEDLDDEIQEQIYEWQDNNLEILSYELELKIEINDEKLEWLEYLLKKVEGNVYKVSEAWTLMNQKQEISANTLKDYGDAAEEVYNKFNSIDPETGLPYLSQDGAIEKLKEYRSDIINELSNMLDLDADMLAYYGDVLGLVTEEIEKQTSKFDDLNSVLDHYNTLLELTGQSKNYKAMDKVLSTQADIAKNQAAIAKRQYETYANEVNDWKAKMEAAQAAGDEAAYELYKQNYEAAYENMVAAQDDMYTKTEEWLEDMKALYENKLADLGEQLEKALTGGISFDELTTAMERSSSLQEEYLTTTNQIYETNKLMRQAQQEIDKTTNSVAKKKLAAYIQETEQLQNQSKLSNYELEIQQAKYDLLLAEIALEEAQQAKSTVRLQRDSEGNLGYVYTADADKIADAEQELADKQNSLYNIGLEGANDYAEKYAQTMQEMYETLSELHQQYLDGEFASEDEYNNAVAAAKEYYYQKLEDYSSLYKIALTTDSRVVKDAWSSAYNDIIYKIDELKYSVEDYLTESKSIILSWAQDIKWALEDSGLSNLDQAAKDVKDASDELNEAITGEGGLLDAMDKQIQAANEATTAYADERKGILDLITEYENLIAKIGEYVKAIGEAADASEQAKTKLNVTPGESTGIYSDIGSSGSGSGGGSGSNAGRGSYTDSRVLEIQEYLNATRKAGLVVDGIWGPATSSACSAAGWPTNVDGAHKAMLKEKNSTSTSGPGGGSGAGFRQIAFNDSMIGYDTGGYTGSWGSYGKLAMLHQKELVLNAGDTENFLASMEVLDHILEIIDLQSASSRLGGMLSSPTVGSNDSIIEQHIEIHAQFPDATNHSEIEEAFNNLINKASQYANRK